MLAHTVSTLNKTTLGCCKIQCSARGWARFLHPNFLASLKKRVLLSYNGNFSASPPKREPCVLVTVGYFTLVGLYILLYQHSTRQSCTAKTVSTTTQSAPAPTPVPTVVPTAITTVSARRGDSDGAGEAEPRWTSGKWEGTGSIAGSTPERQRSRINSSPSALSNCVSCLGDARRTHVPFRDNPLTRWALL